MGAFAGALGKIGEQAHEKNILNLRFQHEANQNIAAIAEHLGQLATDDETKAIMAQVAADAAQGKKPDLSKAIRQSAEQRHLRLERERGQAAQAEVESRRQPLQGPNGAPSLPAPNMSVEPNMSTLSGPATGGAAPALLPPPGIPTGPGQPGGGMTALGGSAAVPSLAQAAGIWSPTPAAPNPAMNSAFRNADYDLGLKERYDVRERERLGREAHSLGFTHAADIANYINNKTIRDLVAGGKWASAGQGIIYNTESGEYKLLSEPTKRLHVVSGNLVDESGNVLFTAPQQERTGTDFAKALALREEELGRTLSSDERADFRHKFYGEPLYPVIGAGGTTPYLPRSQAQGKSAPRTLYDAAGNPTTGGVRGQSLTPPAPVPEGAQESIAGMRNALAQFKDVESMLRNPKFTTLGPAMGRIKLAEINKLGGLGATPQQIQMATALQRLLSQQAFAQGGKQLTPTELEQFSLVSPNMNDTLAQAIVKAREGIKYLRRAHDIRVSVLSPRQQGQLGGGANLPAPPGEATAAIQVGQSVTLKNGSKVVVTVIHPDGTFDADPAP